MEKQNLFTEEELAKVTDEAERKHLIECAQDQSKIDIQTIMKCWMRENLDFHRQGKEFSQSAA